MKCPSPGPACNRFTVSYEALPGLGHFIHTYMEDGSPLPTFQGEPERVAVPEDIDAFAQEIWEALDGEIDAFVATVGTGGTLTGTAEFLKSKKPDIKICAVEPDESAVLSGGKPGPHRIQGIGAGFVPKVLNTAVIDEVIRVSADDAGETARQAARQEGLLVGISSGAALYAAMELSKRREFAGKNVVTLLPDTGERYLSTWLFDDCRTG